MVRISGIILLLSYFSVSFFSQQVDPEKVYQKKMSKISSGTLPELIVRFAQSFQGTPYVANTLEANEVEALVCRFDALDCTTLVDVSLAMAIAKQKGMNYNQFLDRMINLRYPGGVIDGYPSRLHYFVSWKNEHQKNGLIKDITEQLGGGAYQKKIYFMSAHATLYKGINSPAVLEKIKTNEALINQGSYYYLPKEKVPAIESKLQDGDIIGITSTIEGLDCNHQGIIKKINNRAYLVHASTSFHKVITSTEPLSKYLNSVKKHTGIIVMRLPTTL
jgi:hypothetical protein